VEQASKQLGIELSNATVAVCGATGDIAVLYAALMPADVAELLLIARNPERLQELQSALGRGKIMGWKKRCPGRYCGLGC